MDLEDCDNAWTRGMATGLAEMHRLLVGGNDSNKVREVALDHGLTLVSAQEAGLEEGDLEELRRAGVPENRHVRNWLRDQKQAKKTP